MNLQILELCLATLGVELHILVWSYREHEVGHGDAGRLLAFCCTLLVPSQLDIVRNCLLAEIGQTALCSIHNHLALLHIEINHGALTLVV